MHRRRRVVALLVALASAGALAAAVGAARFVAIAVLPGSIASRLAGPAGVVDPDDGLVHGRAMLRPVAAGGLPPCRVEWRRGKHDRIATVHDVTTGAPSRSPRPSSRSSTTASPAASLRSRLR